MGPDLPLSGRALRAAYPFAFALPLVAGTAGILLPGVRLLVPLTYVVAAAIACFVALVLYVPVFELS